MRDERPRWSADSTCYLPTELRRARGIELISLYVSIDGDQRPEVEIDDYEGFFEQLRASQEAATTSQPSIGDFVAVYEPLLDEGREIASIHISSGISGTFEAAGQARDRLIAEGKGGERIHLYDSRSACGGMGLCALAASAAASSGASGAEAVARAEQARDELKMWFAIDTLEYLRRGGRIGGAAAWIGSALKIKPILTLEDEITPVERVRTRSRSIERLREYARERHESGADAWVVQYIQDSEAANALADECREIFGCEPAFISEVGPVIGAHAGPGLLGVGSVTTSVLARLERSAERRAAAQGEEAADGKADDRGPDHELVFVLVDLAAPVGQLGDLVAEHLDRVAEVLALDVDVAADLGRRAAGPAGGRRARGLGLSVHFSAPSLRPFRASRGSASPLRSPAREPAASRPGPSGRRSSRRRPRRGGRSPPR